MKTCRANLHQYEPAKGSHKGCPGCDRLRHIKCVAKDPIRIECYMKSYYRANKEHHQFRMKAWRSVNISKQAIYSADRKARELQATPKWLTHEQLLQIREFYILAKELSWLSESPLEVDHIIPLQGTNVRGLHVPWNLQLLPESMNCSKGNRT